MALLRKIFFYLFALIYLITCPLIILRMLGFAQDPHTRRWVKTGIIYISSNPPDSRVLINGRTAREATPTIIRDLTPGQYTVRMELEEYEPWENTVAVVDKKATSIENILLFPKHWPVRVLSRFPINKITPLTGAPYLLASSDDSVKNLLVLRLNKDLEDNRKEPKPNSFELEPLFPEESIYRDGQVQKIFTCEPSPFFVLRVHFGDKPKYLWIDPREKLIHIEDISDLILQSPRQLYWEPFDEKNLYAYYPDSVNRINIKAKAVYPNIAGKDMPAPKQTTAPRMLPGTHQSFLINNEKTLLFRRDANLFLTDVDSYTPARLRNFLTVKDNTDVLFWEKTGKVYYIDRQTSLLSSMQVVHHKPFIPKPIAETLRLNQAEH